MAKNNGVRRRCTATCTPSCTRHLWKLPGRAAGRGRQAAGGHPGRVRYGKEAAEARAEFLRQASAGGVDLRAAGTTVADAMRTWLDGKTDLKATTVRSYRQHVEDYWAPTLGRLRLRQVTPAVVEKALATLSAEHPPTSVARAYATLRSFLRDAYRLGALTSDPTRRVRPPKASSAERVRPTMAQVKVLREAMAAHPLGLAFGCATGLGLRRGELAGAQWADLDLDAGTWRVRGTRVVVGHAVVVDTPKSRTSVRTVQVPPGLVLRLRDHRRQQLEGRLLAGEAWTATDYVFVDELGVPLHPERYTKAFARVARSVGLPGLRLHDLRHLSAALGAASGETLVEVSKRLGHSSTTITGSLYSYAFEESAAEHAAARERLLDGTAG